MARSRNIKPGFFKNENLADLDPLARLLFAGLWTLADRDGRLENRPKRIKVEILPYDECSIEELLAELEGGREQFIFCYEVDGEQYIQINNFLKHQNPHHKEQESTIPAPGKHRLCPVVALLIPLTLLLIPLTMIPLNRNLPPPSLMQSKSSQTTSTRSHHLKQKNLKHT